MTHEVVSSIGKVSKALDSLAQLDRLVISSFSVSSIALKERNTALIPICEFLLHACFLDKSFHDESVRRIWPHSFIGVIDGYSMISPLLKLCFLFVYGVCYLRTAKTIFFNKS